MKRLSVVIILIVLQIFSVGAYEVEVHSFSESEIILEISGVQTVDVKVTDVKATVESESLSDSYPAKVHLQTEGDKILIQVDISPIFEDYSSEQIQSITVSGDIEVNGETMEFGKRVPIRDKKSSRQLAPSDEESSNSMYWIIGFSLVLVLIILALFYRKPQPRILSLTKTKSKAKKKKRVLKKAKTKKKAKKRL